MMTKVALAAPLFVCALVAGGLAQVAAPSPQQPPPQEQQNDRRNLPQEPNEAGKPTLARVLVINQAGTEAVPVRVMDADPVNVTVAGMPAVTSHAARQSWEYRQLSVASGQDPTSLLNNAGLDGWETTGVALSAPGGITQILLKRPR